MSRGKKGNRIMKERQERQEHQKADKETIEKQKTEQVKAENVVNAVIPNNQANFNSEGAHAGVVALSDLSLTLLSLVPPTLLGGLSFNILRRHEVSAVPALLISGGLAWMGYKATEPLVFDEQKRELKVSS
jgi:hypothetical protein